MGESSERHLYDCDCQCDITLEVRKKGANNAALHAAFMTIIIAIPKLISAEATHRLDLISTIAVHTVGYIRLEGGGIPIFNEHLIAVV